MGDDVAFDVVSLIMWRTNSESYYRTYKNPTAHLTSIDLTSLYGTKDDLKASLDLLARVRLLHHNIHWTVFHIYIGISARALSNPSSLLNLSRT